MRRLYAFGFGQSGRRGVGLVGGFDANGTVGRHPILPRLVTQQRRPVVARHPDSNELTWFNHMTFFHILSLEPELRELLQTVCQKEEYPHSTLLGDGTEIAPHRIESLREAYLSGETRFEWAAGDILLIDNMLVAHGRRPFTGPRKVLVAMSTPNRWKDVMI